MDSASPVVAADGDILVGLVCIFRVFFFFNLLIFLSKGLKRMSNKNKGKVCDDDDDGQDEKTLCMCVLYVYIGIGVFPLAMVSTSEI